MNLKRGGGRSSPTNLAPDINTLFLESIERQNCSRNWSGSPDATLHEDFPCFSV